MCERTISLYLTILPRQSIVLFFFKNLTDPPSFFPLPSSFLSSFLHQKIIIIVPWADYASSQTTTSSQTTGGGSGGSGGIIRISYDQTLFEKAVKDIITDPQPKPQPQSKFIEVEGEREGEGEGKEGGGELIKVEKVQLEEKEKEKEKVKILIEKDDITLLVRFSLPLSLFLPHLSFSKKKNY